MSLPGSSSGQRSEKRIPADPAQAEGEVVLRQVWSGFGKFIARVTPWLNEIGLWIFGSLIGFSLVILGALITIGPIDLPVKIASAAFAFSLPLNLTGLLLLRWIDETKEVNLEDELMQAFRDESFFTNHIPSPGVIEEVRHKRISVFLRLAWGTLVVTFLMTLVGLVAALWHLGWWIAAGFFGMFLLSLLLIWFAIISPSSSRIKF